MDCSPYDVHYDELAVVSQVEKLIADLAAANAALDELRAGGPTCNEQTHSSMQ